jgi:hypothetical protein
MKKPQGYQGTRRFLLETFAFSFLCALLIDRASGLPCAFAVKIFSFSL